MTEDADLLRRFADEKSEEAFAELVRRHLNLVYSVALRQVAGDVHLAEDVVQQVFTALARKAAALAERPALSGWLYRSTHFAASDVVRAERRRKEREQEALTMNMLSTDSEPAADWEKLRPVLDEAIAGLNERDRDAVSLRFLEGRSFADIGVRLRLTENAARMRVERALDKMHGALGRRGVTSTAAALGVALANQAGVAASAGLAASVTGLALAGATTGGGVAAILTFMSTTKLTATVAGVIAIFAMGTAVYEGGKARDAAASLADANRERELLRARAGVAERDLAASRDEANQWQAKMTVLAALKAAPTQARSGQGAAPPTGARPDLNDPEIFRLWREQNLAGVKVTLAPFAHAMGLSRQQQEKLAVLVEEPALLKRDISETLKASLKSANPPTEAEANALAAKLSEQGAKETEAKMRALLGSDGYEEFRSYFATTGERDVANRIAGQLYYTAAPLRADQADQLVRTMAANKVLFGPDAGDRGSVGGVTLTNQNVATAKALATQQGMPWFSLITDAAVAQAEKDLAPAQVEALRQLQGLQAAQLKFGDSQLKKPAGR